MHANDEALNNKTNLIVGKVGQIVIGVRDKYLSALKDAMASGNQDQVDDVKECMDAELKSRITELSEQEQTIINFDFSIESVIDFNILLEYSSHRSKPFVGKPPA